MITNADQGTLLSWEADSPAYCASATSNTSGVPPTCTAQVAATSTFAVATTSGTSVSGLSPVNIPGQASPLYPALQMQDGSYAGYVGIGPSPGVTTQYNMVAFNRSGSTIWSVPNDYPQIATADDGVIGYSGRTYDSQGRDNGQIGNSLIYAWTGGAYQIGTGNATQIYATPVDMALNFWPMDLANNSLNSTAFESAVETLYVRSFAPFPLFGPDPLHVPPCLLYCFVGDNRSFTTSTGPVGYLADYRSCQISTPGRGDR